MFSKKYLYISVTLLLILLTVNPLYSQQLGMLVKEREQSKKEMDHLNALLKDIEGDQKAGLSKLTIIRKKIDVHKQTLNNINKQINLLNKDLEEKQTSINMLQAELERIKKSYSDLLIHYYSIRNKSDWIMYILASESINQAYKRMQYFREILFLLRAQANEIISMTERLNGEISDMEYKQQMLKDNVGDKNQEVYKLESEQKQSQTVLADLKKRENEVRRQIEEKKKSFEQLSTNLTEVFREEAVKGVDITTGDMRLVTERFEASKGLISWPAIGTIISSFGKHFHPVYTTLALAENNGIDIQTSKNADVYAIFEGEVTSVKTIPKTGEKTIVIRHGAYSSIYFKVNNIVVKQGDIVKAREKIATVAATNEGSVLHFEIRKSEKSGVNKPLNPEKWVMN